MIKLNDRDSATLRAIASSKFEERKQIFCEVKFIIESDDALKVGEAIADNDIFRSDRISKAAYYFIDLAKNDVEGRNLNSIEKDMLIADIKYSEEKGSWNTFSISEHPVKEGEEPHGEIFLSLSSEGGGECYCGFDLDSLKSLHQQIGEYLKKLES